MSSQWRLTASAVLSGLLVVSPANVWALSSRGGPGPETPPVAGESFEDEAAARFRAAGLPPEEAAARAAGLSRDEAWHVAREAPDLKTGGQAWVAILVALLLIGVIIAVADNLDDDVEVDLDD